MNDRRAGRPRFLASEQDEEDREQALRSFRLFATLIARGRPHVPRFVSKRVLSAIDSRPLAELDQLHAAGWREAVLIVDDNFIGNTARAKELCVAVTEWRSRHRTRFNFTPEASLNLVDDPELMQLMKDAGLVSVLLGIELPDESGVIASNKLRNSRPSPRDSAATIQSYRIQVKGGFKLGFRHRSRRHL